MTSAQNGKHSLIAPGRRRGSDSASRTEGGGFSADCGIRMRSHTGQKRCQNIPEFAGDTAYVPSGTLRSQENVLFAAMRLAYP